MRQASRRCSCRCRMNANYSSDVARFGSFFGMTGVAHFSNSGVLPLIRQGRRRHRRHRDGSWMSVTAAVPQVAAAAMMATEFLEVFRKKTYRIPVLLLWFRDVPIRIACTVFVFPPRFNQKTEKKKNITSSGHVTLARRPVLSHGCSYSYSYSYSDSYSYSYCYCYCAGHWGTLCLRRLSII